MISEATLRFRRVVVGFDSSADPDNLLQAATKLARATRAQIHGLFIEDRSALALAELPFVRVVHYSGATAGQAATAQNMRAAMIRAAATCEAALSQSARQAKLSWSFGRASGAFHEQIEALAEAGDLIVVHADPYARSAVFGAFALARRPHSKVAGVVVVPRLRRPICGPLAILTERDPAPARTLQLAAELASDRNEALTLILVADDDAGFTSLASLVDALPRPRRIRIHHLRGIGIHRLSSMLRDLAPSLITADLRAPLFEDDASALALIEAAAAPAVLLGETN